MRALIARYFYGEVSMKKVEIVCKTDDKILNYLSSNVEGLSYSSAVKMLRNKDIRVNDEKIKDNIKVYAGDTITAFIDENKISDIKYYTVVYRDENVVIVDKEKNIEVCDGEKNVKKLLSQAERIKIYPVHRIDRNTDGLVIFALNKNAEEELLKAFKDKMGIRKYYLAEVAGKPKEQSIERAFLMKMPKESRVEIYTTAKGRAKPIETQYKVVKRQQGSSIIEVTLMTGRTHQIRAHMAYLGYPILGDDKYGSNDLNRKFKVKKMRLTASRLAFNFDESSMLRYLNDMTFKVQPKW